MDKRTFLLTLSACFVTPKVSRAGEAHPVFHAGAQSKISLIYIGSVTCVACRGYEVEYFGRMDKMAKSFPEFKEVEYLTFHLAGGRGSSPSAGQLPDHLKWLATEQRNGHAPIQNDYGTPYFVGVVDREVWAQGPAVSSLESEVIPALQRAVRERRAAS